MAGVIAMMNVPPAFFRDRQNPKAADRAHKSFHTMDGDHTTLLNVFEQYESISRGSSHGNKQSQDWCWENYMKDRSLMQAVAIKKQLMRIVDKDRQS